MGRDHEREVMTYESINEMGILLSEYAIALRNIAERMKERNVESFSVRHVTKGRASVKKLGEFTSMVGLCLQEHMFQTAFPTAQKLIENAAETPGVYDISKGKPTPKAVVKRITKKRKAPPEK